MCAAILTKFGGLDQVRPDFGPAWSRFCHELGHDCVDVNNVGRRTKCAVTLAQFACARPHLTCFRPFDHIRAKFDQTSFGFAQFGPKSTKFGLLSTWLGCSMAWPALCVASAGPSSIRYGQLHRDATRRLAA